MNRLTFCWAIALALASFCTHRGNAAIFRGLGYPPAGVFSSSWAHGVSADGSVVVGTGVTASGAEAFRWPTGGGMVGLGDLPGGDFVSVAYGVSADGSVVVGRSLSGLGPEDYEAFRWTSGGDMVGLGDLPGANFYSIADGVSADGSVVVGRGNSESGDEEAFRWTAGGGMVGLGDLPGGPSTSQAHGVSADGSVVVGQANTIRGTGGPEEAFRWTAGGGMVTLGDLSGGDYHSEAYGVSADGSVVVGGSHSGSGWEAFRWSTGGDMVGLGDLPGGIFRSEAHGVSADGSVVVGTSWTVSGEEAFRWTSGGMRSLKDVLTADFGIDLTGWTLNKATAVSANGRGIVGYGYNPAGHTEAFLALLDPLELYWINASGGQWDTAGNWDYVHPATEMTEVYIQPETALGVNGPAATTTIKSLTIGATASGTATLRLLQTGTLVVTHATNPTTINARGRIAGSGTLNSVNGIRNYGQIYLDDGLQLTGGPLDNYGLIRGDGQIDMGLENKAEGEIRVESGQRLWVTGSADNVNTGQIKLYYGTLEFTGNLESPGEIRLYGGTLEFGSMTNRPDGFISGRGELIANDQLTNEGTMAFSGGLTDVYGDVTNPGTIVVSGGSTTTFYDDVHTDGELRISANSSAVFFGNFTGTGGTTGPGTAYLEGDLRPGASPAEVLFGGDLVLGSGSGLEIELGGRIAGDEYDVVSVAGNATLGGTLSVELINSFEPTAGDSFTVMTFGSREGDFATYTGLEMPGGLLLEPTLTANSLILSIGGLSANQWGATGDGLYSDPSNWTNATVPSGTDAVANFWQKITDHGTVTIDSPVTLGTIDFDNADYGYTIEGTGAGEIILEASTGDARVNVRSGHHTITTPLSVVGGLTINTEDGTSLTLNSPSPETVLGELAKNGPGTLEVAGSLLLGGDVHLNQGVLQVGEGLLAWAGSTLRAINLGDGATLRAGGEVSGRVIGGPASTLEAAGWMNVGDSGDPNGYDFQGKLVVGSHTVGLMDSDLAKVFRGATIAGGTLGSVMGIELQSGTVFQRTIKGHGTIAGNVRFNGSSVAGISLAQPLVFPGVVEGLGTFSFAQFTGLLRLGASPVYIPSSGGNQFQGTLLAEIWGPNAGQPSFDETAFDIVGEADPQGYHQFGIFDGTALGGAPTDSLGGTLQIDVFGGYVPLPGDEFRIFEAVAIPLPPELGFPGDEFPAGNFTGWFDTVVLDSALTGDWLWRWEYPDHSTDLGPAVGGRPSQDLFLSATLTIVPEPGTVVLLIGGGFILLASAWRRRRRR